MNPVLEMSKRAALLPCRVVAKKGLAAQPLASPRAQPASASLTPSGSRPTPIQNHSSSHACPSPTPAKRELSRE